MPMTEEKIAELARHLVGDLVWSTLDVPPEMWKHVFMPIALGGLAGWHEEELKRVVIFAVLGTHETSGVQINGYPSFMEFRYALAEDFTQALLRAKAAVEVLRAPVSMPPGDNSP